MATFKVNSILLITISILAASAYGIGDKCAACNAIAVCNFFLSLDFEISVGVFGAKCFSFGIYLFNYVVDLQMELERGLSNVSFCTLVFV